jgi:hypothetical protein
MNWSTKPSTRHSLKATALLWLALAAPASAAILPGVAVDGPSNLIDTARPDVDVAPDGSAALVYLKDDGGVNHPFVSRFTGGAWGAPQRVDTGSAFAGSKPHIAVANGGKVVVTYIRAPGDAVARISPAPGADFGDEHIIQAGGSSADVDLSPNGNGYAVAEASNDVFAERLEGVNWSEVGIGPLDSDPTQAAGGSNRDVRIAASADGAGGAMAWAEEIGGMFADVDTYVRRLSGSTPGNPLGTRLPQGSLPNSNSGTAADQPAVDVDAAGTIWVVYRQNFQYGMSQRHRAIARPITGATVGAGQLVDNMGDAPTEGRDFQQVDVNGAGQGLLTHHGNLTSGLEWASLAGGTWTKGGLVNLSDNASVPGGIPALGENGSGLIAYAFKAGAGANTAKGRPTFGGLGAEIELSNPAFGDLLGSLDASAGSGAYAAATFVQQVAADATTRRLVAAVVDLPQPPGGGNGPPPPPPDTTDPDVTGLALSRTRFRLGSDLPSVAAVRTGTTIRFTISEAATANLRFRRAAPGRVVGGRCRRPTRLNRSRRRCTRMLSVRGSVSLAVQAGARRIKFAGRMSPRRRLRPGRYQLILRATDAAGNVSTPDRARFTLLPRRRR